MLTLAPVLDHKDSKVMISISPPTNVLSASGAKAAIHFYSSSGGKQFYDAKSRSILDCGKTAEVISLRRGTTKHNFEVENLAGGVVYTASVAYRGNDFDWGAESPASAPFRVVPPVAPQAPRLEPVSTGGDAWDAAFEYMMRESHDRVVRQRQQAAAAHAAIRDGTPNFSIPAPPNESPLSRMMRESLERNVRKEQQAAAAADVG